MSSLSLTSQKWRTIISQGGLQEPPPCLLGLIVPQDLKPFLTASIALAVLGITLMMMMTMMMMMAQNIS